MRALICAAVCAFPIMSLLLLAGRNLEPKQEPPSAAITLRAGTAKQFLEHRQQFPAVLRDETIR